MARFPLRLIVLIVGTPVFLLALLYVTRRYGLFFMLLGLIGVLLLMWFIQLAAGHQRIYMLMLCSIAVVMPGLTYWFDWPGWSQYVADLMVLVFLAAAVTGRVRSDRRVKIDVPILLFLLLLVGLVFVTRSFSLRSMQSLWAMALGPLLVVALQNSELSPVDIRPLLRCFFSLGAAQFAVVFVQKMVLRFGNVDTLGGTFGRAGTTYIAVFMSCFWIGLVAYMTATRRWRVGILLAIPLLTMGFAEAKAGFFFASIGSLFVAVAWFAKGYRERALVAAAAVLLPVLMGYAFLRFFPEFFLGSKSAGDFWLRTLTDPQSQWQFYQGYAAGGQAQRLSSIHLAWDTIRSQGELPFGLGLGTLNTSAAFGADPSMGGVLAEGLSWTPSAGRVLLETGVLGLSGLGLLILVQLRHGVRLLAKAGSYRQILGAASVGLIPVFVLAGFYTPAWTFRAVSIPFWVFVAMLRLRESEAQSRAEVKQTATPRIGARSRSRAAAAGTTMQLPTREAAGRSSGLMQPAALGGAESITGHDAPIHDLEH